MLSDPGPSDDLDASVLRQDILNFGRVHLLERLVAINDYADRRVWQALIVCSQSVRSAGPLPMYTGTPTMSNSFSEVCNGCILAAGLVISNSSTFSWLIP